MNLIPLIAALFIASPAFAVVEVPDPEPEPQSEPTPEPPAGRAPEPQEREGTTCADRIPACTPWKPEPVTDQEYHGNGKGGKR